MAVSNQIARGGDADMEHITARIEAPLATRLRRAAAEDERSVSAVIRLAIRRYLDERVGRPA